jgi:5-enolpyruvylshikimate-3-phosphate synthase
MKLRGPAGALRGSTELPGDKSISHRAYRACKTCSAPE